MNNPKIMRVSILTPPVFENNGLMPERVFGCTYEKYQIPQIFNLILAQLLIDNNFEVKLMDLSAIKLKESDYDRLIAEDQSNVYIIYTVNLSAKIDIDSCRKIRKLKPDAFVIFIGPAPTYEPERFVLDDRVFVARGEYEYTVLELLNALDSGSVPGSDLSEILGVSYYYQGAFVENSSRPLIADLDALPFPARELIKDQVFFNPKFDVSPVTVMQTSRGCPYPCLFCVPNSHSFARELENKKYHLNRKPAVRMRSPKSIIEEFKEIKRLGYKAVSIIDDQFIWGEQRTLEIMDGLKPLNLKWGCLARADRIKEPIVKAMAEANCVYVDIGVESFDEDILTYIQKQTTVDQIKSAVSLLKKYKIMPKLNMMFGSSPLETKETIRKSVDIAQKLNPGGIMYGICNPIPGTEYHKIVRSSGYLRGGDYVPVDAQKASMIDLPNISGEELEKMLRWANLRFYLSPRLIWNNIHKVLHPKLFILSLKTLHNKLKRT